MAIAQTTLRNVRAFRSFACVMKFYIKCPNHDGLVLPLVDGDGVSISTPARLPKVYENAEKLCHSNRVCVDRYHWNGVEITFPINKSSGSFQ